MFLSLKNIEKMNNFEHFKVLKQIIILILFQNKNNQ